MRRLSAREALQSCPEAHIMSDVARAIPDGTTPAAMAERLWTVPEVADLLRVNQQTVRNWVARERRGVVRGGPASERS